MPWTCSYASQASRRVGEASLHKLHIVSLCLCDTPNCRPAVMESRAVVREGLGAGWGPDFIKGSEEEDWGDNGAVSHSSCDGGYTPLTVC